LAARISLDGLIPGLGVAAIGAAAVLGSPTSEDSGLSAVTRGLAFPICGLALTALIVGALAASVARKALKARRVPSVTVLGTPALFTLSALALLVYDHFVRLDTSALALALATMLAAFA